MPQSLPTITARHAFKDAILKQELKKVAKAAWLSSTASEQKLPEGHHTIPMHPR